MPFDPTVNKYVSLVETKPELLSNVGADDIAREVVEHFRDRKNRFQSLFCEIGSGSGGHLLDQATRNPEHLFLGFELRFKRAFRTAEKAEARGIENIHIFRGDARLIERLVFPEELQGVYINFPDPWDRERWKKHRIINPEYLALLERLLKSGGILSYKSDHAGYFSDAMALFDRQWITPGKFTVRSHTDDLYNSEFLEGNVSSEFEKLFKSKGTPVHFVELQKVGMGSAHRV